MATKIHFTYNDQDIILEFNRDAVRRMENAGFDLEKAQAKPVNMLTLLWNGAFFMHHPNMKQAKKDEIFEAIGDRSKLWDQLMSMYSDAGNSLFEDQEGKSTKKISWEIEK